MCFLGKSLAADEETFVLDFLKRFALVYYIECKFKVFLLFRTFMNVSYGESEVFLKWF